MHARRVPDLLERAHHPPPSLPVPPVHLRSGGQRPRAVRAGGPGTAPARADRRRRGILGSEGGLHRARRAEFLGARLTMALDTSKIARTNRGTAATAKKPNKAGAVA